MPPLDGGEGMALDRMPNEPPERETTPLRPTAAHVKHLNAAISVESYIDPGAGLAPLQDWSQDSDYIFDTLFMNEMAGIPGSSSGDSVSDLSSILAIPLVPMVRTYNCDSAMCVCPSPPLPLPVNHHHGPERADANWTDSVG